MIDNISDRIMAEYGAVDVVGSRTEVQTERLRDLLVTVTERIPSVVNDDTIVLDKSVWKMTWKYKGRCGTKACILGWHIELSERARADGLTLEVSVDWGDGDITYHPRINGQERELHQELMDYFGITEGAADDIFINHDYGLTEVAELIKELLDD